MKKLHVEQVAWFALMMSFAGVCVFTGLVYRPLLDRLHSQSFDSLLEQARHHEANGEEEQADKAFSLLMQRYPDREQLLVAYGEHLESVGRQDEAGRIYAKAASLGRQRFSAVRRYASFLERQGAPEKAISVYRDYVRQYPDDLNALLDLGLRCLDRGDCAESVGYLAQAATRQDLAPSALAGLGKAYRRLGRIPEAVAAWRKLASMGTEPDKQLYLQDIAAVEEERGDLEAAFEAWQSYIDHFPGSVLGLRHAISLAQTLKHGEDVRSLSLRLRAIQPPQPMNMVITPRLRVIGVSPLAGRVQGGETVAGAVYFQPDATISNPAELETRFALRATDAGSLEAPHALQCQPERAGTPPLLRGDTVRQPYALRLPADLIPGTYCIVLMAGNGGEEGAPLWTIQVEAKTQPGNGTPNGEAQS